MIGMLHQGIRTYLCNPWFYAGSVVIDKTKTQSTLKAQRTLRFINQALIMELLVYLAGRLKSPSLFRQMAWTWLALFCVLLYSIRNVGP